MENNESSFTILIADDDPDDRLFAEKAFLELGFTGQLLMVKDGEELLNYLNMCISGDDPQYVIPDFILLDLNMPVKSGWESLEEIRSLKRLQDVSVVIWTAYESDEDRLKSIEMGAEYYLTKPRGYSDLISSISSLMKIFCDYYGNEEPDRVHSCYS